MNSRKIQKIRGENPEKPPKIWAIIAHVQDYRTVFYVALLLAVIGWLLFFLTAADVLHF